MIKFTKVTKRYENNTCLDRISFGISPGERACIVGPGGCGKTTILKVLSGLVSPEEGQVQLIETDMLKATTEEKEQTLRKVGMAFQQGGLFDFMSVKENLMFAMENMTHKNPQQMQQTIKKLLDGVKLSWTENMFPHELSGGMVRRIGIARALCTDPLIAIFDEPTSGLDPVTSTIILNMIDDLGSSSKKSIMLIATSNIEIAIRFAKRIIVLNEQGQIAADGQWQQLLIDGPQWVRHLLSVRLLGLDLEYAYELNLPQAFIEQHWDLSS